MGRKCSHCGNTGHNSRTCTTKPASNFIHNNNNSNTSNNNIIRLFGVHLDISDNSSSCPITIKKSLSLDCLSSSSTTLSSSSSFSSSIHPSLHDQRASIGYLSDGLMAPGPPERKKGVPWSEEEHRTFLVGLKKLGKGDWRGISRQFVTTRTPTQVASHAQKYFLRQTSIDKKRRRASLFDMVESGDKTRVGQKHGVSNIDLNVVAASNVAGGQEGSCGELVLLHTINSVCTEDEFESSLVKNKSHHHHRHHLQPELELTLSSPPPSAEVAARMPMGGPISVT